MRSRSVRLLQALFEKKKGSFKRRRRRCQGQDERESGEGNFWTKVVRPVRVIMPFRKSGKIIIGKLLLHISQKVIKASTRVERRNDKCLMQEPDT